MQADLENPFDPSCCDGGETSSCRESAQPCGCDASVPWVCQQHLFKAKLAELKRLISLRVTEWDYRARVLAATSEPNDFFICARELEQLLGDD